jgi:hypothetical protein
MIKFLFILNYLIKCHIFQWKIKWKKNNSNLEINLFQQEKYHIKIINKCKKNIQDLNNNLMIYIDKDKI